MRSSSASSGPRTERLRRTRSIPRNTQHSQSIHRKFSRSHDECDASHSSSSDNGSGGMERGLDRRGHRRTLSVGAGPSRHPNSRSATGTISAPLSPSPYLSPSRRSPTSVNSSIDEDMMPEDELAEVRGGTEKASEQLPEVLSLDKLERQNLELKRMVKDMSVIKVDAESEREIERLRSEGQRQKMELQRLRNQVKQQRLVQQQLRQLAADPASPPTVQLRKVHSFSYGDDPTRASVGSASGYVDIIASPGDDVSPLKTTDSPGGGAHKQKGTNPAVVSPGGGGDCDADDAAANGPAGRRGRSRGPRGRAEHNSSHHNLPTAPHRTAAASPSPAPGPSGSCRRLGRAVDAVLARRKRGGTGRGGPPVADGSSVHSSAAKDPEQALTDEEKYVLAKIIVTIDSKLEKELDAVKVELRAKTEEEGKVQEELEKERDRIMFLKRELEEVKQQQRSSADRAAEEQESKRKKDGKKGEAGELDDQERQQQSEAALVEERKRMEEQLAEAERDHERSIRAIQRVLADVTTDRDEKIELLKGAVETLKAERDALACQLESSTGAAADTGALEEERAKAQRLADEVGRLKSERQRQQEANDEQAAALEEERARALQLTEEIEKVKAEQQQQAAASSVDEAELDALRKENEALKKDLQLKVSSLETAKMMITSLESANGSQANDLRGKLKERNEEVAKLKIKVEGDENEIESLKAEVVDLQKKYVDSERSGREAKAQLKKQRFVHRQLKAEISKISSSSNVTTARGEHEEEEVEVAIVGDVSAAVEKSLRLLVEGGDGKEDAPALGEDFDDNGSGSCEVEELTRKLERLVEEKEAMASKFSSELAERSAALREMEDAVKEQREEMERFRAETEKARAEHEASVTASQVVIQQLREESASNAEQLAKKEQELAVLRESLKEPSTGYISDDDESDEENEEEGEKVNPDVASRSAKLTTEAENLELMLVQGNANSMSLTAADSKEHKAAEAELETLRRDKKMAAEKMKQQEESLANAKMIISSLEKSNKSMLEDLRNRLHDSNTAIVSLLEKSTKHEEAAASLKSEVEKVRKEKEKEKESLEMEAKKLKEEALESAKKLNEQSQQVGELQKTVERYESYARRMKIIDDSSTVSSLGTDEGSNIYFSDGKEDSSFDGKEGDMEGKFPVPDSPMTTIPHDSEEEV